MEGIFPFGFSNLLLSFLSKRQASDVAKKLTIRAPILDEKEQDADKSAIEKYAESFQSKQQDLYNPFNSGEKTIQAKELTFHEEKVMF